MEKTVPPCFPQMHTEDTKSTLQQPLAGVIGILSPSRSGRKGLWCFFSYGLIDQLLLNHIVSVTASVNKLINKPLLL